MSAPTRSSPKRERIVRTKHHPIRSHRFHQKLQRALIEHRRVCIKAVEIVAGRMLTFAARDRMMMPRVFQTPQQECKTPAAVSEANPQRARQPIKRSAQNQCNYGKLCFRRHANRPRHHVFRHPLRAQHIPGMDEHRRAFIRAVMKESYDSGIVKILTSNMIADLYAQDDRPSCNG